MCEVWLVFRKKIIKVSLLLIIYEDYYNLALYDNKNFVELNSISLKRFHKTVEKKMKDRSTC